MGVGVQPPLIICNDKIYINATNRPLSYILDNILEGRIVVDENDMENMTSLLSSQQNEG